VHWQGEPAASTTGEDVESFIDRYPSFKLKDELLVEGGERCHVGLTVQPQAAGTRRSQGCPRGRAWPPGARGGLGWLKGP